MSNSLNNILKFGNGLLSKKKYDFNYKYDAFDFLKSKFLQKMENKKMILKNIYKK